MYKTLLLIGLGGFIGSVARYLSTEYIIKFFHSNFPMGTFAVNIIGCLLIGLIYGLFERFAWLTPEWRFFLATGICGGFTTFSTFSLENIRLLQEGHFTTALSYMAGSLVIGLIATFAGIFLAKI